MDDIVERIRSWPSRNDRIDGAYAHTADNLMVEAAAEIERLREKLDALRHALAVIDKAVRSGIMAQTPGACRPRRFGVTR